MYQVQGQVEYIFNVWNQTHNPQARKLLADHVQMYSQLAYDTGAHHGAFKENISYILKYDDLVKANGAWIPPAEITLKQQVDAI